VTRDVQLHKGVGLIDAEVFKYEPKDFLRNRVPCLFKICKYCTQDWNIDTPTSHNGVYGQQNVACFLEAKLVSRFWDISTT